VTPPGREATTAHLRAATAAYRAATAVLADRDTEWRSSVRDALTAGVAVSTVARLAGISPSRVYQIRDSRR
jgi:DNA-binding phage protein